MAELQTSRRALQRRLFLALVTLLLALLAACLTPTQARAETVTGECGDSLTWSLDFETGVLSIHGTGDMWAFTRGNVAASATNHGPSPWLIYESDIKSVVFDSTVTSIGEYAFSKCSKLESVVIPSGVTTIGEDAFEYCWSLESVVIPASATTIEPYVFFDCNLLKSAGPIGSECNVEFGWTSTIPANVFYQSSIESAILPEGITTIEDDALNSYDAIDWVVLPSTITYIGAKGIFAKNIIYALPDNSGITFDPDNYNLLTSCQWHYNRTSRDSGKCGENLTWSFNPETGVLTITGTGEMWDFDNFRHEGRPWIPAPWKTASATVTSVNIGEGVTYIGGKAFDEQHDKQTNITRITLPSTLQKCDSDAFTKCALKTAGPIGSGCDIEYGWTESIPFNAFGCFEALESVSFPVGLQSIGNRAFENLANLKTVDLSTGVTTIGSYAFAQCENLESVDFSGSVGTIGQFAFRRCKSLTSLDFSGGVGTIDKNAFDECQNLSSVSFSGGVTTIGNNAFYQAPIASLTFPEGLLSIGEFAFYQNSALTSVTLPNGLTKLGAAAFEECSSLPSITIPGSVTDIGTACFEKCSSLTSVVIAEGEYRLGIGYRAFANCDLLEEIHLPSTVYYIDMYAFLNCPSLTDVYYPLADRDNIFIDYYNSDLENATWHLVLLPRYSGECGDDLRWTLDTEAGTLVIEGTGDMWSYADNKSIPWYPMRTAITSLTIGEGATTVGKFAFYDCDNLSTVTLPDSLEELHAAAFYDCDSLRSISLPKNVYVIAEAAFYDCDSLEEITLPKSMWIVIRGAFNQCFNLRNVYTPVGNRDGIYIGDLNDSFLNATWHYGHTHSSVETATVEPTCAKDGYTYEKCVHGEIYGKHDVVPALGHDFVDGVCSRCGRVQPSIARLAGTYANETSAAISGEAFAAGSCEYAIVACDDGFADAMSASGLAGTLNCPILLSNYKQLSDATRAEIERLGASKIYLIGGIYAMTPAVEEALEEIDCVDTVERIWGAYSWDTSVACAQKIVELGGNPDGLAIVAQSGNFQDALSMSPFAYKYGVPIFLEMDRKNNWMLPDAAVNLIRGLTGTIYVAGGRYAVDPNSVEDVFGAGRVERLAGTTGYDTSNAIANYMVGEGLMSADTVCIAYGGLDCNGVDALSGGALAGKDGGVMLLIDTWTNPTQIQTLTGYDSLGQDAFMVNYGEEVHSCYILGGKYVVQPALFAKVRDKILQATGEDPAAA